MCCTCDGSCNHVGPHSLCPAHGGQQASGYLPPPTTRTTIYGLPDPGVDATNRLAAAIERLADALSGADNG
jgi:hypothetical protein